MKKPQHNVPECYGNLEKVFPEGSDGLRQSPPLCMACVFKSECLRDAMSKNDGLKVQEKNVDRAYDSGMIGFFSRWSRKKELHRKRTVHHRRLNKKGD
jgi:hypothetical protein